MINGLKIPIIFSAVDKVSKIADKVKKATDLKKKFKEVAVVGAVAGSAIFGGLSLAANSAINFEDSLADVAKTTGLQGKQLDDYGKSILNLSKNTRSSIDDILSIGVIGGQLGIAQDQLESFTISANKFAVALGGDYSAGVEGAISSVGKLNVLFKDTKNLNPAESLNIAGSMINELTNMGVKAENINDFALRVGRLPEVLKPSLQSTLALGTMFEKLGVNSEVASSGFNNLIIKASQNLPPFATQMKISTQEASKLLSQDPVKFASKFAQAFKGMNAEQMANKLKVLKLNSNEVIGAVGALASGNEILEEAMKASNQQYQNATSLTKEYDTKNNTTKANLEKLQNKIKATSITIGAQLLPIISKVLTKLEPIISSVIKWIENNPKLAQTVGILAIALYGLSGAITLINFLVPICVGVWGFLKQAYLTFTVAQWALNAAMAANPIGLTVVAIVALIALIGAAIYYYEEWGATILWLLGPFGMIIALVMEIIKYWSGIKKAFKDDGIVGGIKAIGKVIAIWLLRPVEQILTLLSKIPGISKLTGGTLDTVRQTISSYENDLAPLESPQQTQAKNNNNNFSGNIGLNINDPNGFVGGVKSSNPLIPINVTRTNGNR